MTRRTSPRRPAVPSRGDLLDQAAEVARRLVEFGEYGGRAERAALALRRRRPGLADREYARAVERGLVMYRAAVDVVAERAADLWARYDTDRTLDVTALLPTLRRRAPGFRTKSYRAVLEWVFYWRHVR